MIRQTTHFTRFVIIFFIIILASFSTIKSQTQLIEALDRDGDNKADPTIFRPGSNAWYTLKTTNSGLILNMFGVTELDTPVPGDYDGDGLGDIAVWRESNGNFYYIKSSDGSAVTTHFGQVGDEPVARDYDGDGKTDLAVVRRQSGNLLWYVLKSSDNSILGYNYGLNTDFPAPGDYDGDGRFDFAVQRKLPNERMSFWINKSSTGANEYIEFGNEEDLFVPGDYDGDNKTDLAFARFIYQENTDPPYIEWWIRKSTDQSVMGYVFGNRDLGDFPAQGDYNGDGKTDLAVWRSLDPNNQPTFFTFSVSNQQSLNYAWGITGDLATATYDTH